MTARKSSLPRVPLLYVATPAGEAGRLAKDGQHSFTYSDEALRRNDRALEISLTMPLRPRSYAWTPMLPVFQTFLPEGYLKQRIVERFGKVMRVDDMALLALTGSNAIGCLRLTQTSEAPAGKVGHESLDEILQDQGSRDLFEHLCDRYLISSGVGGVQPKVLLSAAPASASPNVEPVSPDAASVPPDARPAHDKTSIGSRATLRARQFIVKVGGGEFPGLAENEYHCLRVARIAGLEVPEFYLSADRQRLVIERFDYDHDADRYLGFEDMVSLQGSVNERKYDGSHEQVARAIATNVSPAHHASSLANYFASVVLSMALRNGDAHLKNYGLLYRDPGSDDCRLSPLYDVVCTTVYLPKDRPALSLAGKRGWPSRETLCEFGRAHCMVEHPALVLDAVLDAVASYRPDDDSSGIWARMSNETSAVGAALARP